MTKNTAKKTGSLTPEQTLHNRALSAEMTACCEGILRRQVQAAKIEDDAKTTAALLLGEAQLLKKKKAEIEDEQKALFTSVLEKTGVDLSKPGMGIGTTSDSCVQGITDE